ncbi:hypothetical protein Tco_0586794 [Tanacetum coccineum]
MMGELTYFLGLQIKQNDKGILIFQEQYTRNLHKKYEISDSSLVKTPMVPPNNLGPDLAGKPVNETSYRGMIMSLMYLTTTDLISNSPQSYALISKDSQTYTMLVVIWTRKSILGACQILGGKLVCWSAKKQQSVAMSTTKAEYVAAAGCCASVAKTTLRPKGSLEDKDSWGNISPTDMEPINPTDADLSGINVRAFLLSDDEAQESEEDILGAGEEMDEEPQAASIAETHHQSPPPQADKPQSSHAPSTEASDTDSLCNDILMKYDNILPLTERQLVKYLRKMSNALFAMITEDNWEKHKDVAVNYVNLKASIDDYYDENIAHRDQTDKNQNAVKDDSVINKKISEATESFTKFSTNITDLQSSVNTLQEEIVGSVAEPFSLLVDLNIKSPKCKLAEDKFSFVSLNTVQLQFFSYCSLTKWEQQVVSEPQGGSYAAIAPKLELGKFNKWKKQMLCYLEGMDPYYLKCIKDGLFQQKTADGDAKPESKWTPDERRGKATESLSQTYTRYKTLLNELANDGVNLSKHEINVGFMNSLPEKWLTFSQGPRNGNHTQTLDLVDIYERFVYEDNLIQRSERSSEEYLRDLDIEYQERALLANLKRHFTRDCFSKKSKPSYKSPVNNYSSVSKGFQPKFTPKLIQSFSNSNSQADPKFKKDYKAEYKKIKAKLALLEASPSSSQNPKTFQLKNKGLVSETFDWDEEEVSDEKEVTQANVLMALANDEVTVRKNHARNGE